MCYIYCYEFLAEFPPIKFNKYVVNLHLRRPHLFMQTKVMLSQHSSAEAAKDLLDHYVFNEVWPCAKACICSYDSKPRLANDPFVFWK